MDQSKLWAELWATPVRIVLKHHTTEVKIINAENPPILRLADQGTPGDDEGRRRWKGMATYAHYAII